MQSHSAWLGAARGLPPETREVRAGDVLYCCVPMFNSGGWVLQRLRGPGRRAARGHRPAVLGHAVLGPGPLLRGHPGRHPRGHAHLPVAGAARRPRPRQPAAGGGLRTHPARAGRADEGAVRAGGDLAGVRPERGHAGHHRRPAGRTWKPNSAGVARPDFEVRVLDERRPAGRSRGEVGEICIRPKEPGVLFSGYFNASPRPRCGPSATSGTTPATSAGMDERRRAVLRRPQGRLHAPQGPQHLVVRGGAGRAGPPGGAGGGGARRPAAEELARGRGEALRRAGGRARPSPPRRWPPSSTSNAPTTSFPGTSSSSTSCPIPRPAGCRSTSSASGA